MADPAGSRKALRLSLLVLTSAAAAALGPRLRATDTLTTIHAFNGTDGATPYYGLTQGSDGTLYGTTYSGGLSNVDGGTTQYGGVLFSLATSGGSFTLLHEFNPPDVGSAFNTGGANPNGAPVIGANGQLYGVTEQGGTGAYGVFYTLTTSGGSFSLLRQFTSGTDPEYTSGPIILNPNNSLYYGTGGTPGYFDGEVYSMPATGASVTDVFEFPYESTTEGGIPSGPVLVGQDGNIYGVAIATTEGGIYSPAIIYKVGPTGSNFTILHTFTAVTEDAPESGLIQDANGVLYGTTQNSSTGAGEVYSIHTDGTQYTVLHSMSTTDGTYPWANLLLATDGTLYGCALQGGADGYGTLFNLKTDGSDFTVVHVFTGSTAEGGDHGYPNGGLIQGLDGNLYGTTEDTNWDESNTIGNGTIFQLALPTTPKPVISSAGTATGTYDVSGFSYTITASYAPTSFTETGALPTGLSFSTSTGQITGTPVETGTFDVTIGAVNAGGTGTAALEITIGKASATVTLGSLSQTYSGSAESATATTNPASLTVDFTYDGSSTPPTNVGSYTVVGTINSADYQGSATGTLEIGQATATVNLGSLSQTYSGAAESATATTNPTGLTVNFTYNGSSTAPTAAGSYTVVGTISDANYQGSATGTLTIAKETATVTLGSLSQTYSGSAESATATTNPSGLTVTFTYNGSSTAPTGAGSYAVVGTINDANYQGSATGTLTIAQAPATVTLGSLTQNYSGVAESATATTNPSGLTVDFTYNGSSTPPTLVGSYTVVGTVSSANYQGSASGTLTIAKAIATVTLGSLSQTYSGAAESATATTNPSGLTVDFTYNGSSAAPTAAGSYAVVGTISDANYQGSSSGTLTIAKETATVTLGSLSQTYSGSAETATATTNPAGLTVNFTYNGSSTAPTAAGSYAVVGTISDPNYQGSSSGSLTIAKAPATVTLGNLNPLYSGSPINATATTNPSGLTVDFTYNGSSTPPTNTGTYTVVGTISDPNYQGSATGTLAIGSATGTVTLGSLSQTFDGSAESATATTNPPGLTVNFTYNGSATAPTNAGNYAVVGTISSADYQGSASGTFTILPASQTITFNAPSSLTVDVSVPLVATASSGLPVTLTLLSGDASLAGNVLTPYDGNGATVVATQAGDANHSAAAPVTRVMAGVKLAQAISFAQLINVTTKAPPFTLNATATSGLPVTYTIDSGPALLSGSTLTLTGVPGVVTITASQPGNDEYAAASSVAVSFNVIAAGGRIGFGSVTGDAPASEGATVSAKAVTAIGSFGCYIDPDGTGGTLVGYASGDFFEFNFNIAADGSFQAQTAALLASGAVGPTLTFSGTVASNTFSCSIAELSATLSATLDPTVGQTAAAAGLFSGPMLDSAAGTVYVVVGTQGEAFILTVSPTQVTAETGTVNAAGAFTATIPGVGTIAGEVNPSTATVSGSLTTAGGTAEPFLGLAASALRTDRLVNLSTLATVTPANVLYCGFVIGGSESKAVLLRAVGPGLAPFGVSEVLAHPRLQLYDSAGNVIDTNAGWGGDAALTAAFAQTGAFQLAAGSADCALLLTLSPGTYTMAVSDGANDAGGAALAEVYDASVDPQSEYQRLVNISSRGDVSSGTTTLTGGFIITGNSAKTVLIRGAGPGLTPFGITNALSSPLLQVFDQQGNLLAENQGWGDPVSVSPVQTIASVMDIEAAETATGAFPFAVGSSDCAVIVTLPPGSYSAKVSGVGTAAGTALVEIYEVPPPAN